MQQAKGGISVMKFALSINCACDISAAQMSAYGVYWFKSNYRMDGKPFADRLEYEYDYDNVVELIVSGKTLTRDTPTYIDYEAHFDSILEKGVKSVVHLTMNSHLTDDYDCAMKAVKVELLKFPKSEIYIVDTRSFSVGMQPLLELAIKLRDEGASASEAYVELTRRAKNITALFIPHNTDSLKRLGKISRQPEPGGLLKIQSVLKLTARGMFAVAYRTRGNAMTTEKLSNAIYKAGPKKIYLSAGSQTSATGILRKKTEERMPDIECETGRMGLFSCSVLGGSAYAVAFEPKTGPKLSSSHRGETKTYGVYRNGNLTTGKKNRWKEIKERLDIAEKINL